MVAALEQLEQQAKAKLQIAQPSLHLASTAYYQGGGSFAEQW